MSAISQQKKRTALLRVYHMPNMLVFKEINVFSTSHYHNHVVVRLLQVIVIMSAVSAQLKLFTGHDKKAHIFSNYACDDRVLINPARYEKSVGRQ